MKEIDELKNSLETKNYLEEQYYKEKKLNEISQSELSKYEEIIKKNNILISSLEAENIQLKNDKENLNKKLSSLQELVKKLEKSKIF